MREVRIIVVGATGYVGSRVLNAAAERGVAVGISSKQGADGLGPIDLARPEVFDYSAIGESDRIVLCSAISSPDLCAREYDHAYAVNVTGTNAFITNCTDRGARVVFLSSDVVYGATDHPADEGDDCRPVGVYGAMKRKVEEAVEHNRSVRVARLSYVLSDHDKFSTYLAACANQGVPSEVFHPFSRRVVHLGDVVAGLLRMATDWDEPFDTMVNFGGAKLVTRLDIAHEVKKRHFPDLQIKVVEPEDSFFRERPRVIDMATGRFEKILGRPPLSLEEAVALTAVHSSK